MFNEQPSQFKPCVLQGRLVSDTVWQLKLVELYEQISPVFVTDWQVAGLYLALLLEKEEQVSVALTFTDRHLLLEYMQEAFL